MANKIQIRRGSSENFVGQLVCQGELIWLTDIKKLYIGTNGTALSPVPVGIEDGKYTNVKVISPDASEVAYDNTKISISDRLSATTVQDAIDELATEKQMKLGGSAESNGKVVVATSTLGTVNYLGIDSTPTDNSSNLVTSGGVKDDLDTLNSLKQNRPNSATVGNIATFDANKDTVDSGKKFTTSVGSTGTDENIPTEKAIRSAINDALTSAVNYKGMCRESELPQQGEKVGDFWSISDFNETAPGRNGRAIWNGGNPELDPPVAAHWDKEIDEFFAPDETTITLNGSGALAIKNITQTDTTSSATPGYSGTFTTVDSVTRNSYGQVTGINTKTVTMPSLGENAGQAAKGDEAEYKRNKVTTIGPASGTGAANDTNYPSEKAVRTELDTKANKSNITASQNYSLVNYNSDGIVISSTDIIDGGTF